MAIEEIEILGALLSYVKSIATYAPIFFVYIISVVANVNASSHKNMISQKNKQQEN
jgi:hypothetical protein